MKQNTDGVNKYNKLLNALFLVILLVGLGLRFYQHFMGRSMWEDETHFALNFIKYDFWRLTKPLDDLQAGPIFFLWGVKAFVELFGYSEIAFRSLTWITCILTLPLFYYLVLELTQKKIAALLSFLIFSINVTIIYFSSELKPYGIDVSAYLLITYLTVSTNVFVRKNRLSLLAIFGSLAILISNTAFIIVFCSALNILYGWYKNRKITGKSLGVLSIWGVVFVVNYFLFIHDHPSAVWQKINYSFAFVPRNIFSSEFVIFFKERFTEIFFTLLLYVWRTYFVTYIIFATIVVSTVAMIVKKQRTLLLFIWVPILITLTLSYLHIYPFVFRLILFLMPGVIILLSYGTYLIAEYFAKKLHFVVGAVFFVVCTLFFTKENIERYPTWTREIKPALDFVNKHVPSDMNIYMSSPVNAYNYYYYRNYVTNKIHEEASWTLTPSEFYGMVADEVSEYVFFYGDDYATWPYNPAVEDFTKRGLVVKDFQCVGYKVSILKAWPNKTPVKVVTAQYFDSTAKNHIPLWGGSITSYNHLSLSKGKYNIFITSHGTPKDDIYPINSIYINDEKIGTFTSYATNSRSEPMFYEQLEDGDIQFKIHLDNDESNDSEDRNTFVNKIYIYTAEGN